MDDRPVRSLKWKIIDCVEEFNALKRTIGQLVHDDRHWVVECDSVVATDVFALVSLAIRFDEPLTVVFNGASDDVYAIIPKDKCTEETLASIISECSENQLTPEELTGLCYLKLVPDDSTSEVWDA